MAGDGLITPEAVHLELPAATVGSRGVAYVVDTLLAGGVLVALLLALDRLGPDGGGAAVVATIVLVFLVLLGYPVAFETLWQGRTPGKAAMGLRVVTDASGPVTFRHAAVRAGLGVVELQALLGLPATATAMLSTRGQRLGDLVAGTVVVRERAAETAPGGHDFVVPAGLESWVAALDTAGLGPRDYLAIRTLLLRRPQLQPEVAERLATALATRLADRIQPPPPVPADADAVLTGVAAAYQRRQRSVGLSPSSWSAEALHRCDIG